MKQLKENFFVKTVYAYFNLFTWIYPLILLRILGNALGGRTGQGLVPSVDFFNLFQNESELFSPNIVPVWISILIISANLLVFALTYLIIIKLNNFLKNTYEGNPFSIINGGYLKTVGIIVIIIAVFLTMKDMLFKAYLIHLSSAVQTLFMMLNFLLLFFSPYFIIGLFTFILGEFIIRAAKIKEELDLTI